MKMKMISQNAAHVLDISPSAAQLVDEVVAMAKNVLFARRYYVLTPYTQNEERLRLEILDDAKNSFTVTFVVMEDATPALIFNGEPMPQASVASAAPSLMDAIMLCREIMRRLGGVTSLTLD